VHPHFFIFHWSESSKYDVCVLAQNADITNDSAQTATEQANQRRLICHLRNGGKIYLAQARLEPKPLR
jgi:hypothetical protein